MSDGTVTVVCVAVDDPPARTGISWLPVRLLAVPAAFTSANVIVDAPASATPAFWTTAPNSMVPPGVTTTGALASVTVLHPNCMESDALATVLGVLGVEDGMAWARERNIAARFLSRDGADFRERTTPAFDAMLG